MHIGMDHHRSNQAEARSGAPCQWWRRWVRRGTYDGVSRGQRDGKNCGWRFHRIPPFWMAPKGIILWFINKHNILESTYLGGNHLGNKQCVFCHHRRERHFREMMKMRFRVLPGRNVRHSLPGNKSKKLLSREHENRGVTLTSTIYFSTRAHTQPTSVT